MRHLEVSFIVDPVLSGDEVKSAVQTYKDMLTNEGANIVHIAEMGLRQLAYPINKRTTGVYFCIEFSTLNASFIPKMELAMKRDERLMRFLTISLDKYGVKYNEDKRNGKIGKKQRKEKIPDVTQTPVESFTRPTPVPVAVVPDVSITEEE